MGENFKKSRDDIFGLLFGGAAIILIISLWTYNPSDPSFNSFGTHLDPKNGCGILGAFISDIFFQGFGLASWLMPLVLIFQSYIFFSRKNEGIDRQLWLFGVVGLALLSGLMSLHLAELRMHAGNTRSGGFFGELLTSLLLPIFHKTGLAVVLWISMAGFLTLFSRYRISEGVAFAKEWSFFAGQWLLDGLMAIGLHAYRAIPKPSLSAIGSSGLRIIPKAKQRQVAQPATFPIESSALFEKEVSFTEEEEQDQQDKTETVAAKVSGYFSLASDKPKRKKIRPKLPMKVENWEIPKLSLLEDPPASRIRVDRKELEMKSKILVEKLAQFSVRGEVTGIKPGPAVTMFEFKPNADVKISKITDLADDLSLALSSESVRIVAPIPGRDVVGIETSNNSRETVFLKSIIQNENFWDEEMKLPIALGRKADGEPRLVDLRKMPHLLVAGSTGSGKSVFVVSLITGLLLRHSPKTLRLVLVDPKQVDLAAFSELPHLVMPPITDSKKAVGALRWAIREMEKRYRSMSKFAARGLESFNETVAELSKEDIEEHNLFHEELDGSYNPKSYYYQSLPYICIVVEEFGDLMAVDKVNVEQAVVRLAQMARACGIHLILAMQSPRKDVVTGLIKTNIPGRVSFKVASKMDSRIILDESGAERLLARGDMLFLAPGVSKPERHHGPYLPEKEIEAVVSWWKDQGAPQYDPVAIKAVEGGFEANSSDPGASQESYDDIKDERYDEILEYISSQKEVSASLIQRRFRLGYPRAARMIEIFESEGVVGPANGSKPRTVLIRELPR